PARSRPLPYTTLFRSVAADLVAVSDPMASRELSELNIAIARLPEEQRQVLLLIGLEGIRYDEAAAVLDVPIGTVRSRLSRAREADRKSTRLNSSHEWI